MAHDAVAAYRQQPVGRVFDCQGVDAVQQRQFIGLSLRQPFGAQGAVGQRMRQPADGEIACTQKSNLEKTVYSFDATENAESVLQQQRN